MTIVPPIVSLLDQINLYSNPNHLIYLSKFYLSKLSHLSKPQCPH